jgi:hypothetical protein
MAVTKATKASKTSKAKLDNLSNSDRLTIQLKTAEKAGVDDSAPAKLSAARRAVVEAADQFSASRYALGMALHRYKAFFVEDRCWMKAALAIARTLDCDERTVRRTIDDYKRVAALPKPVIDAALAEGVDLAKQKHSALAVALTEKLKPLNPKLKPKPASTKADAQALVSEEISKLRSAKQQTALPKVELDKADKRRWEVRLKIRTALNNIPNDAKLDELIAALEEEMYEVWGSKEPVSRTITPKPGKLDIDGKPVKKAPAKADKADAADKAVAA